MRPLLVIGCGGHARSVLDCVLSGGRYGEVVFATNEDDPSPVPGYGLLDEREISPEDMRDGFEGVVVAIGDNRARLGKVRALNEAGVPTPALVHPRAHVSALADIGPGTVVLAGAAVNAFARVGAACIVNTNAVVEHECSVGDGAHLSPGAVVAGGCRVGEGAWLCANSGVADHLSVAPWSVLAGGGFLAASAEAPGLYAGVPATLRSGHGVQGDV